MRTAYCEGPDTLENLCSLIPGDAQQYSLFKKEAQPAECPFRGSYTFTYSRGHGDCKSPVSRFDTCTETWRSLFRYQACPDVQGTESSGESPSLLPFLLFVSLSSRSCIDQSVPGDAWAAAAACLPRARTVVAGQVGRPGKL